MTTAKQALAKQREKTGVLTPTENMNALLLSMGKEISRALPEQVKSERFQRVALTAFSNNQALQKCDPISFLAAMMQSAQLGLEPNTPLGQAYLIPFNTKNGMQVQFQIGYKGLLDLAYRTGEYKTIYAHAVHENDEFSIDYGLEEALTHKPLLAGDRGPIIGYYAVYKLTNGGHGFSYMTKAEVEAHRKKFSKAFNGPWKDNFDSMALKTVVKQALKYAPLSIEMQKATQIDEMVATADEEKAKDLFDNNVIEGAFDYAVQADEAEVEEAEQQASADSSKNSFLGPDFTPIEQ